MTKLQSLHRLCHRHPDQLRARRLNKCLRTSVTAVSGYHGSPATRTGRLFAVRNRHSKDEKLLCGFFSHRPCFPHIGCHPQLFTFIVDSLVARCGELFFAGEDLEHPSSAKNSCGTSRIQFVVGSRTVYRFCRTCASACELLRMSRQHDHPLRYARALCPGALLVSLNECDLEPPGFPFDRPCRHRAH